VRPVSVHDYERLAGETLPADVHGYYAGGSEDERTLRDNPRGWERWKLRPRVLVDVAETSTATTVLGRDVSLPVLLGPAAFQRLAHPDGEHASARAAAAAGTVYCLSTLANAAPAELPTGGPRWFQLYAFRDAGITRALVDQAVDAGFGAVVLTVDAPVPAKRDRDVRNGFSIDPRTPVPSLAALLGEAAAGTATELFSLVTASLTWADLDELVAAARVPVVLKGVLTAEDAALACEHGVGGIVVSNHGGRQLDGVDATADVLEEVVQAVAGRAEVYIDGGVRRGTDVVKALAIGARAALVARPYLWGLAVAGEDGVRHVLELYREEVALALANLGCATPAAVTRQHVHR
jgi:isopentenyl diphosphate isomerase/L-lactate dehydrogenase-like FMN-dependent dehydrogenase